jgi:hypothetical protein
LFSRHPMEQDCLRTTSLHDSTRRISRSAEAVC